MQTSPKSKEAGNLESTARQLRVDYTMRFSANPEVAAKLLRWNNPLDGVFWNRVARNVQKLTADPGQFMGAAFIYSESRAAGEGKNSSAPLLAQLEDEAWCIQAWEEKQDLNETNSAPDIETSPEIEWRLINKLAADHLKQICGTVDPCNPMVMRELREEIGNLPAIFRCVHSCNDPIVLERFGEEAREYLRTRPAFRDLIESEGNILPP